MSDTAHPWDRRPGESAKAYEAFALYLQLGADRSLGTVAQECIKSRSLLGRWSARYEWQARAVAYDHHVAQLAEQARAEAMAGAEARWAERRIQSREDTWAVAEQLHQRAVEMLSFPLATIERVEKVRQGADGRQTIIEQTIITPARWSLPDAAYIVDIAVKLARLSVELETDRSLVLLEGLKPRDLDAMSLDELKALRQMISGKG